MSAAVSSGVIEVLVPDIGDLRDVAVIKIAVAQGDRVATDDTLVVLESDKATLDLPSPGSGRVVEIKVAVGDRVSAGSLVLLLEADATADPPAAGPAMPVAEAREPAPVSPAPARPAGDAGDLIAAAPTDLPVHASPALRRYARTLGVTLAQVAGSGPNGRITREDLEGHVKARLADPPSPPTPALAPQAADPALPGWPRVDFAKFGPVERVPLSRIARISGPALARNAVVIPHVTTFDKADVTELEQFRRTVNEEAGPDDARVTMLAFAVKAAVAALKAFPRFNASLDGQELVLKSYWNIGFAADTPDGLVVPVIKSADTKGVREIAAEMAALAATARSGRLGPGDMEGATFTISSLGGIGATNFTPIINAPEVAILGMVRAEEQPVWRDGAACSRLIQPLSLSWDHRVVDGVASARFLGHIAATLGDPRRILH